MRMKLNEHISEGQFLIRACEPGKVTINDDQISSSCIVTPGKLLRDWSLQSMADLSREHLRPLFELETEVVIFGSGNNQRIVHIVAGPVGQDDSYGFRGLELVRNRNNAGNLLTFANRNKHFD